jgi:Disulphide bond corrector protein DsbC
MTQEMASSFAEKLGVTSADELEFYASGNTQREKLAGRLRTLGATALGAIALSLCGGAFAQPSLGPDTVFWSASAPAQSVTPGSRVKVTLRGAVKSGWHVYGFDQLPDGPTPMRVTLDASDTAAADGAPKGSTPTKVQDPSFNLQTQFYASDFTVTAPVRIAPHAAAGQQQIPVSVRFQTCNGGICQPPKTVRLSVPITIRANG